MVKGNEPWVSKSVNTLTDTWGCQGAGMDPGIDIEEGRPTSMAVTPPPSLKTNAHIGHVQPKGKYITAVGLAYSKHGQPQMY